MIINYILGESLAECLTALNLPCEFLEMKVNCTHIKYDFNLKDLHNLKRLQDAVEMLSAHIHKQVNVCKSTKGHFCLAIQRDEREYPNYLQTWWKIQDFDQTAICFGKDENNENLARPLYELQSMLISGASGSGKSVFLNNIILNIHCHTDPTRLVLIDPKEVEFCKYENSDRLVLPLATDIPSSIKALATLCEEMDRRYKHLRSLGLRDNSQRTFDKIVCIVDELADLMLTSKGEVENYIVRLAQKGRACGIYLILATQRPAVKVVTGLIKANIATRVAFACTSIQDSLVMLDHKGAEELLGKGDCLIKFADNIHTIRCQAPLVTNEHIQEVAKNWQPRVWNTPTTNTTTQPRKSTWLDKLLGLNKNRQDSKQKNKTSNPVSSKDNSITLDEIMDYETFDDEDDED